jgi:predicted RND superfamily exporter protein
MGDLRGGLVIVVVSLVFAFGIQAYFAVVTSIARGWWILRWLLCP